VSGSALAPLGFPRFRNLWLAGLVSFLGTWVHNVAARWTAATLSDRPLLVTAVDALQLVPMVLLGAWAGSIADAWDRRRVLVATHLSLAAVTSLMALLAASGRMGLPALLGLTGCMGVLGAITGPAWQATVPRQVPDEEVPAAVALMSTGFNLARAIGPSAGAWMLLVHGPAAAFATNAASYLLISALLWQLPPQLPARRDDHAAPPPSPLAVPRLRELYAIGAGFGLLAMPSLSLLPVVARDGLRSGAAGYGQLLSAFGLGAVASGLLVARGARRFGERAFLAGACGTSALGFFLLARAETSGLASVGAAVAGAGWIGAVATINAGVQVHAPAEVRARALAAYLSFAVGGQALGSVLGGWLSEQLGLTLALQGFGAGLLGLAAFLGAGYGVRRGESG
jgi:MFS family permease